jgi:hypothetical protein
MSRKGTEGGCFEGELLRKIGGSTREEMSGNGEHGLSNSFLVFILSQDIIRLFFLNVPTR